MKTKQILIGMIAAGSILMAGSVTIPNTFTAGGIAKASEVNENFSAVKTAVNGNANDISTNSNDIATNENNITTNAEKIAVNETAITTKQNNITGGCGTGKSIRVVYGDGTVACEDDNDTTYNAGGGISIDGTTIKRADGFVSVSALAFRSNDDQDCKLKVYSSVPYIFFSRSSSVNNCMGFANVSLPQGATVTSFSCKMHKDDHQSSEKLKVSLMKVSINSWILASVELEASHNNSAWITETDTTISTAVVDNELYAYYLRFDPPDNTDDAGGDGEQNQVRKCTIGYEFN